MREIEQIKNATVGKETREPIARTLEKIASNFNNGQNTSQEVVEARGTHSTLNARLNVIESKIGDLSKVRTKNKTSLEGILNEVAKKLGIVVVPPTPHDTWREGVSLTNARYGHYACVIDGAIYVITGRSANGLITSVEKFDFTQKQWNGNFATISGRKQCSCANSGKNIYLIEGATEGDATYNTSIFNVATKSTEKSTNSLENRIGSCCVVNNDLIYVFGGEKNISSYPSIRVYAISSKVWMKKGSVIHTQYACSTTVGGKAYIFGGYDGSKNLNTVWIYDFATDTVSVLPNSMPTARRLATCAVIGKKIYVIGGYTTNPINIVECLDTETDEWSTCNNEGFTARYDLASCVYKDEIYLLGGHDGTGAVATVEIYKP